MAKFYVCMTDKVMSGWGLSQGRINKLVFECDSYREAMVVKANAERRGDMSYININCNKPYYNKNKYYTQLKNKTEYPMWYEKNAF